MQALLHPDNTIFHGPNSIDHFNHFSLDEVIREMRTSAPDVISLLSTLKIGRSDRHDDQHTRLLTQLRVMSSLCTLLKGRSIKVLGLQLLLTFMLLARATSKQVCIVKLIVVMWVQTLLYIDYTQKMVHTCRSYLFSTTPVYVCHTQ